MYDKANCWGGLGFTDLRWRMGASDRPVRAGKVTFGMDLLIFMSPAIFSVFCVFYLASRL